MPDRLRALPRIVVLTASMLAVSAVALTAVLIDDRDVILDSGKTLQQSIIDGDLAGGGDLSKSGTYATDRVLTAVDTGAGVKASLAQISADGTTLTLADPGSELRGFRSVDNATTCPDPASGVTMLCTIAGQLYARDSGIGSRAVPMVLARTVTPFVVDGPTYGTAVQPVYSYAVPDGLLGTTHELRVHVTGTIVNSGTSGTGRLYIRFGGVLVWEDDISFATAGGVLAPFELSFTIRNTTSTSAQILSGTLDFSYQLANAIAGQGIWTGFGNHTGAILRGSSTIVTGSGGADVLQVDFQGPNAEATAIWTMETATVELW